MIKRGESGLERFKVLQVMFGSGVFDGVQHIIISGVRRRGVEDILTAVRRFTGFKDIQVKDLFRLTDFNADFKPSERCFPFL